MDEFGFICIKLFGLVSLKMCVLFYLNSIVQLGPKVQSSVQVLAQSRTLYSLCYPPQPPTTKHFFKVLGLVGG